MRPLGAVALLALVAASPVSAQLAPPESAIPPEKPAVQPLAEDDAAAAAAGESTDAAAEPSAEESSEAPAADAEDSEESEAPPPEPPQPLLLAETDLDLGICLGRLETFGTVYERGRPVSEEGGACGIVNPVRVTEIVPGVTLSPPGIMRCATAAALAKWVSRFAVPASTLLPDRGRLTEVTQGSAYICRRIGNAAEGALSEHAFGNAVDVMTFRFASGPPIPVEPREREGTPAEAFQRTVRAAACLGFTTVLGPGEEEHDNHLHLDIKARDSGYRLCQ